MSCVGCHFHGFLDKEINSKIYFESHIWNKLRPLLWRLNKPVAVTRYGGSQCERVREDTGFLHFLKKGGLPPRSFLYTWASSGVLFPWNPPPMQPWPVIYIKSSCAFISSTMASFLPCEPAVAVLTLIYARFQTAWITIPFLFIKVNPHKDTFIHWLAMPHWTLLTRG